MSTVFRYHVLVTCCSSIYSKGVWGGTVLWHNQYGKEARKMKNGMDLLQKEVSRSKFISIEIKMVVLHLKSALS